jgi:hypothetical protein
MKLLVALIVVLLSILAGSNASTLRSKSPTLYNEEVKKAIESDAWETVDTSKKNTELLGVTKAKVAAKPMEVVLPDKTDVREVDYEPIKRQLQANLNILQSLAKYVNVLVDGSKYKPAPDSKTVDDSNMKQYYKLAKKSENMLFKCNKALKDIDHTRAFDNHNTFISKWVPTNIPVAITNEEKNSAKQSIFKRSTIKQLDGDASRSAKVALVKIHYEANMNKGEKVQLAYDMCVASGRNVDKRAENVVASNPDNFSALKALEETRKLFHLVKKHHDNIPDLINDLKKEIKRENKQLAARTKQWKEHAKVNDKEAHEQYLDRVEMDDDMEQLAQRKAFNLVKATQRLNRLHVERGRPCSGSRCETLRRVVGALRRAKKSLSDADVCDAAKDCDACSKLSFCGWCDTEKTCLEGNVVRPRFGPSCSGGWFHQDSPNTCAAKSGAAPATPVKYPDPSIFFDPECANFNGSPGDCARAKLRLIAIEHMCLAKGGTAKECEKEKELEAAKISIEQVQKATQKAETLKALKDQQLAEKKMENAKLKKCREINSKHLTSHPRFAECNQLIATSLLELSEFSSTGAQGTIAGTATGAASAATKAATGAAAKAASGATGAKADDDVVTEDMKASEEEQAKKDAEKEKLEKEENAKLNGNDDALIKAEEEKAKKLEDLGVTGATGAARRSSTGTTGATGATGGSLASKATGPSSVTGASIGKAATAMEHPDSLGTEKKAVGPDDEEEEILKKKNIATVIGDGVGPNGKAAQTATISVEMKMSGVSKKEFEDNAPAFTASVAVAWGGDKNLASMVQVLDLKQGLGVDNGVAAPAAIADEFLEIGSTSTGPAGDNGAKTPSLDDPMGDDTVVTNPNTRAAISFKILFQLVGANARKKALEIANRAGGEKGASTLASQLPDSLSKATLKVTSRPKVTVGNTQSTKARNVVSLDEATRKAQEKLALHTAKALEGAMWSHYRPHSAPGVQQVYRKRNTECGTDKACLKRLDDQLSAMKRMDSDAVDGDQIE